MNHCAPDWNAEDNLRYSHDLFSKSNEKKSMPGPDNELLELLHRNGHVSMQSQTNPEPLPQLNQVQRSDLKPINSMHEDETASWFRYALDDTLEKELCPQVLYEMQNLVTIGANKPNKEGIEDSNAFTMRPPKPHINDIQLASSLRNGEHVNFSHLLRHNLSNASKCVFEIGVKEGDPAISPRVVRENRFDTIATSSSGQLNTSNQNSKRKRKDGDEFECHNEEAAYEFIEANKPNQQPASTRKSRAAEVHNLSERRRRDKINEKMRALQELIPHCNKTDKASMLDEAIEYLKSLQLQLQIMWMGNGMATMMFPSVQQHVGRASIPSTNKPIQLSRTPPLNQMNPINFPAQNMESYDRYYGFPQTQLAPQAMNLCSYGSHMLQQNQTAKVSGSNSLPTSGIHFKNGHSG